MVIHTAIGLFQKYHNIFFVVPPKRCISIVYNFSWGERLLSTHSLASFVIDLSSFDQVGIFFSECV